MAVTASFSSGILTVFGDELGNNIVASRNAAGTILINGGAVAVLGGTPTIANTVLIRVSGENSADAITFDQTQGALPMGELFGGGDDAGDVLTGGEGFDQIFGEGGPDTLLGKGGGDVLTGGAGDDTLTGGDGEDQLFGGAGNDRMIWNPGDDSDLFEGGDGLDTAEIVGGNGAEVFSIGVNAGRILADRIDPAPFTLDIGTSEALVLNANAGDDVVTAGAGLAGVIALTIDGGAGNDTIAASNGRDSIGGADGNDSLDGGGGADTMAGGAGDDEFRVDAGGDQVIETAGGGIDTVTSSIAWSLSAEVERLILAGSAVSGTGNALDNRIEGNAAGNLLYGGDGRDTLLGGDGDDGLRGQLGDDVMTGGAGNDRFFVDSPGDKTIETAGEGIDTVFTEVSRALGANLEIMRLLGAAPLTATGNELNNKLFGNSGANLMQGLAGADTLDGKDGADTLSGGAGNDTLTGGSQADVFRFAASNAGADRITDFQKSVDRFQLSGGSFSNAQIAGADTILTHNGGTVRVEGIANLTLAQWNALVIPGGESGGLPLGTLAWHYQAAVIARAQNDILHLPSGDWLLA